MNKLYKYRKRINFWLTGLWGRNYCTTFLSRIKTVGSKCCGAGARAGKQSLVQSGAMPYL